MASQCRRLLLRLIRQAPRPRRPTSKVRARLYVSAAAGAAFSALAVTRADVMPKVGDDNAQAEAAVEPKTVSASSSERRFRKFASLSLDGVSFMTPRDFVDAMIQDQPRPRVRDRNITAAEARKLVSGTEHVSKCLKTHSGENPDFWRQLGDRGIISYDEYLFLVSLVTKPYSGMRMAFEIIDRSGENTISESEFSQFCLVARRGKGKNPASSSNAPSTLRSHFFGPDGAHSLNYKEFSAFTRGLQREVLKAEFVEYSHGLESLAESDFAHMLLRYADITEEERERYLSGVESCEAEAESHADAHRILFNDVETFFRLLNDSADFFYACRLFFLAGHSLVSRDQFARAAKVSIGGDDLAESIIDVIFAMFDKNGTHHLSCEEFFAIVTSRKRRHLGKAHPKTGWKAFKRCLKEERKYSVLDI